MNMISSHFSTTINLTFLLNENLNLFQVSDTPQACNLLSVLQCMLQIDEDDAERYRFKARSPETGKKKLKASLLFVYTNST